MPELPEVYIASRFINQLAGGRFFRGPIIKSSVSKMKPIEWGKDLFTLKAGSRGKEMQMVLTEVDEDLASVDRDSKSKQPGTSGDGRPNIGGQQLITFGFGMSGKFSFDRFDQVPKHAHLQFFTAETPANVLSFVDYRRFGTWDLRDYDYTRGPDPTQDYHSFRQNVLNNLDKTIFTKAICEVMHDQKYFNGIGNYLRAEILYRAKIPPFTQARSALESLDTEHAVDVVNPDILDLCNIVPREVFGLAKGGEGYQPNSELEVYAPFRDWLRCYMQPGMKNLVDRQKRTMWFDGPAGDMAPEKSLSRHGGGARKRKHSEHDTEDDEGKEAKEASTGVKKKKGRVTKKTNTEVAEQPPDVLTEDGRTAQLSKDASYASEADISNNDEGMKKSKNGSRRPKKNETPSGSSSVKLPDLKSNKKSVRKSQVAPDIDSNSVKVVQTGTKGVAAVDMIDESGRKKLVKKDSTSDKKAGVKEEMDAGETKFVVSELGLQEAATPAAKSGRLQREKRTADRDQASDGETKRPSTSARQKPSKKNLREESVLEEGLRRSTRNRKSSS